MDANLKKILLFLSKNESMAFDISDIAYHLKYDEQFVEGALRKLENLRHVHVSKDRIGRITWHINKETIRNPVPPFPPQETSNIYFEQKEDRFDSIGDSDNKAFPVMKFLLAIIVVSCFVILFFAGKGYVDNMVALSTEKISAAVSMQEYQRTKDSTNKVITQIKQKIFDMSTQNTVLNRKIDSLNSVVFSMQEQLGKAQAAAKVIKPKNPVPVVKKKK
jgi:hypothetical protein